MDTKRIKGWLFPKSDVHCNRVVFDEVSKVDQVVKYCSQKRIAIQAGGNVGVFPVRLASYFDEVYTFEPDPVNYDCLVRNIKERKFPNIEIKFAGLSDENTTGRIYNAYLSNCGTSQLIPGYGIDVLKLDDQFKIDAEIDLIYLDIEGHEYKALVGAKAIIDRCKPVVVVENKGLIPEYPSDINGNQDFRDWVCSLGYKHETRLMRDDVFTAI